MLEEIKAVLEEVYLDIASNYNVLDLNHDSSMKVCVAGLFRDKAITGIEAVFDRCMEDGGWSPCSEGLPEAWNVDSDVDPEDIIWPEYIVTIKDASEATTLRYDFQEDTWFDDKGNTYEVVAWRPLPAPYCPKQNIVGEDYKRKIMKRFLKVE